MCTHTDTLRHTSMTSHIHLTFGRHCNRFTPCTPATPDSDAFSPLSTCDVHKYFIHVVVTPEHTCMVSTVYKEVS